MNARDYQPGEAVPGTVYRVVRLIGAGGMGTVYDVEDTTIGKRYVLKTLHPRLGAREDLARRMQNEARTLARLHHPNIVEVITAGVTADDLRLPFYVMERLSGQSLRLVLEKKGQLELTHAYHIGIDLLDALDHAHDKGVVHRDVKPDNIFLHRTAAGITVTKLLDFGIVSLLDEPGAETAGRFVGTLRYAAPEQLRGERPTPKTDVYAAALVVYEMLAGHGPFDDAGDPHEVGAAHLQKPAPLLSRSVPVPAELDALIAAALAKDPDARPRDAFSFAASLRNLKRRLNATPRGPDATENRATAPAMLGVPSGPAVNIDVRQASPSGPYVISPGVASTPAGAPDGTLMPSSTLMGMVPPTVGPGAPTATRASATGTAPDGVDRLGPTHTQALASAHPPSSEPGAAGGLSRGGLTPPPSWTPTQRVDVAPERRFRSTVAADVPGFRALTERPSASRLDWPDERGALPSEAPQVRSLHAGPFTRSGWGAAVATMLGVGGFAAMSLFVFASRGGSITAHAGSLRAVTAGPAIGAPSASPAAVVLSASTLAAPAPTIAPPALDDPGPRGAADRGTPGKVAAVSDARRDAPAAAGSSASPAGMPRAMVLVSRPPASHPSAPRPAAEPVAQTIPDRPGPGF